MRSIVATRTSCTSAKLRAGECRNWHCARTRRSEGDFLIGVRDKGQGTKSHKLIAPYPFPLTPYPCRVTGLPLRRPPPPKALASPAVARRKRSRRGGD